MGFALCPRLHHLFCERPHSGGIPPGRPSAIQSTLLQPSSFGIPPGWLQDWRHQNQSVTTRLYVSKAVQRPTNSSYPLKRSSQQRPLLTTRLVILIVILYIFGGFMQVSAHPWPQLNPPLNGQGVFATSTSSSIDWWPFHSPVSSSLTTVVNPIPLISLSPSLPTITSYNTLSSTITSSYTSGISSQTPLQIAENSTADIPSAAVPVPSPSASQEQIENQAIPSRLVYYFIPVGFVLGAMLGASTAVVLTRRCGKNNSAEDEYHHPFPNQGGHAHYDDPRDEQEKQWVQQRRTYSEDEYETDSNRTCTPKPERVSQEFLAPVKAGVPVSESFYDDVVAETRALELDSSLDEEPPTPYARLQSGSIRRTLLRNIDLDLRQTRLDAPTLHSQSLEERRWSNHPSIASPVDLSISPRQMRDLFFLDQPVHSRDQWVTAEKLLDGQHAEDEDSDGDDELKNAILLAGINEAREDSALVPHSKGIPTSLSALSTAAEPRRLVKPRWRTSSRAERELFIREEVDSVGHRDSPSAPLDGHNAASEYSQYGRFANIDGPRQDVAASRMSADGFGSSSSVYDDQPAHNVRNQGRTITFGAAAGNGIEHRLGLHS